MSLRDSLTGVESVKFIPLSTASSSNRTPSKTPKTDSVSALVTPVKSVDNVLPTTFRAVPTKERMVAEEMYQTECNYLKVLNLLIGVRKEIETESCMGKRVLLSPDAAQLIFGRIPPLIKCHTQISSRMKSFLDRWDESGEIAEIWISITEDLEHAYVPYLNNYDLIKSTFEEACTHESFSSFVKKVESHPKFYRNSIKDLLMRPVQRLPSVSLLFKELERRTVGQHAAQYHDATLAVENILSRANRIRAFAEPLISLHQKFDEIDCLPAAFRSHSRQLMFELEAMCLASTENPINDQIEGKKIKILIFTDYMIVCRVKKRSQPSSGTFNKLLRRVSSCPNRKPYRMSLCFPLHAIRTVRRVVKEQDEKNAEVTEGMSYAFQILHKTGDKLLIVRCIDEDMMQKVAEFLTQSNSPSSHLETVTFPDIYNTHPDLQQSVRRNLKRTESMMSISSTGN